MTFPANIDLSSLNGSNGFKLSGEADFDHSGYSVASAGDVNGDGFADLIVGAPDADANGTNSGASYVVFGQASGFSPNIDLSSLNGSNGFKLTGAGPFDLSGYSVASAGDVNGDGFADLIVGARFGSGNTEYSGAGYVVFGQASGFSPNIDLSSLNGSNGFKLNGTANYDEAGHSVASAGDINGDGFADLIVGAPYNNINGTISGASYVVFGKASGFDASIDPSSLDGSTGFTISRAAGDKVGWSVASAGDVNDDGFADLIVGARDLGESFVVFGKDSAFDATLDLATLDGSNGFALMGIDGAGRTVASAGDVNGDGFADVVVGVPYSDAGASYVVFGKASGFDAAINLSHLDGNDGFKLSGVAPYDYAGLSVASAGDVNGDGFGDLIVGAPYSDANGTYSGASYVVFGRAVFGAGINLASMDGSTGFKLTAAAAYDHSGYSVAAAGDVNGDGFDDLIVGAPESDPNGDGSGATYVVFGAAAMVPVPVTVDLSSLDGTTGFKLNGAAADEESGYSVASAGDINGDGFADLIVGAPNFSGLGHSYVVFGKASAFSADFDLSSLNGSTGFKLTAAESGDSTGFSVASAGDVNGDGFTDLIVSAARSSSGGDSYVVFGHDSGFAANLDLSSLDGSNGFKLTGGAQFLSGRSVASAGDINGDGFADLIIGAPYNDANGHYSGTSYVVFGKPRSFAPSIDLATLDGSTGFTINGEADGDRAGWSVASAGDVNRDGFDDLIVGARRADGGQGASYVVFGQASSFGANFDLTSLDGSNGFKLAGEETIDQSGSSVASAGDINGDGFADLIIGAPRNGDEREGAGYVVFGKASGFAAEIDLSSLDGSNGFKLSGVGSRDATGRSVASAGDFNGDGFDDLIIGADDANDSAGATYIVFGKASGFGAEIDLSSFAGYKLSGVAAYDYSGYSVSSAGDVNGDGFDDVIVGAYKATGNVPYSGASYVMFGVAPTEAVTRNGTAADNDIHGGAFNDRLNGLGGDDTLTGLGGNDQLNGGAGADTMVGGTGNDVYFVDNAGDVVTEVAGEGTADTVITTLLSYTLAAEVERLAFIGSGNFSGTGNDLANILTGKTGDDILTGLGGNDRLNGGTGADTMFGGTGNDVYFVDNAGDVVTEAAGEGTADTVIATSSSYTLAAEVERLTFTGSGNFSGTGNDLANILTGATGDDTLTGLDGNDRLNGGAGADAMVGGTGNDVYFVDNAGDVVTEAAGEGTADTVVTTLSSYTLAAEVERLTFTGSGNFSGTGNDLANILKGGTGDDTLDGGGGRDRLTGGAGEDTFAFSSPLLVANFASVTDFTTGTDTIALDSSTFAAAGPTGPLAAAAFFMGTRAHDGDDRIIYNSANGYLMYDADGNGAQAAVTFGKVAPGLSMTANDFKIV